MDQFTNKANKLLKGIEPVNEGINSNDYLHDNSWMNNSSLDEDESNDSIVQQPSSSKAMEPASTVIDNSEEDAETPEDKNLKKLGLNDNGPGLAAVNVAQKLATKPGRLNLPFIGAQAQMNSAYGTLMKKIATRIKQIANGM